MKNEITIPVQVHDLNEKDLITAAEHRKKYSLLRDLQAEDFNRAIVYRLAKDLEKQVCIQSEDRRQVVCEKCNKEFSVEITSKEFMICPECK
jgi:hypothetical protein